MHLAYSTERDSTKIFNKILATWMQQSVEVLYHDQVVLLDPDMQDLLSIGKTINIHYIKKLKMENDMLLSIDA